MGLDMYLETEQYIPDYTDEGNALINTIKANSLNHLGEFRPKTVSYELAYWRKANAVHNWFVKNVQDGKDECQSSYVSLEKLQELRDTCARVLENNALAQELFPSAAGFFFGSTEYDDWYFSDLLHTVEKLDKILKTPSADKLWISYRASW